MTEAQGGGSVHYGRRVTNISTSVLTVNETLTGVITPPPYRWLKLQADKVLGRRDGRAYGREKLSLLQDRGRCPKMFGLGSLHTYLTHALTNKEV